MFPLRPFQSSADSVRVRSSCSTLAGTQRPARGQVPLKAQAQACTSAKHRQQSRWRRRQASRGEPRRRTSGGRGAHLEAQVGAFF